MKIVICGQEFKSQKAAADYIRQCLVNFNMTNEQVWFDLVQRHPEKDEKIGTGIRRFFASQSPLNPNGIQLNFERVDGTIEHISWRKCISGRNKTSANLLRDAMRLAVKSQTAEFKRSQKPWVCAICKTELISSFEAHTDHYPATFKNISEKFLKSNTNHPKDFEDDFLSNAACFKSDDASFENAWTAFHFDHAKYRILCHACNNRTAHENR